MCLAMATYISLKLAELQPLLAPFDLGGLQAVQPVQAGSTNSIFRLDTGRGVFALVCFEARVVPATIPYFLGLMQHLVAAGVPCPTPLLTRDGQMTVPILDRPSVLLPWLAGQTPTQATPALLHGVGALLAKLHLAGQSYPPSMPSLYRRALIAPLWAVSAARADAVLPGSHAVLQDLLDRGADTPDDASLPRGAIHGDVFLDNLLVDANGGLTAILDFNYACSDSLLYDLAMAINGTCWQDDGFAPSLVQALLQGYQSVRGLEPAERLGLPAMLIAALQPYLHTRLYDWVTQPPDNRQPRARLDQFWQRLQWAMALDGAGWSKLLGWAL
jgi:homoserine kinase type II